MYPFSGPAEVRGHLETWRNRLQFVLIFIFIFLPWLRINNQPALLLNFFDRHFVIFGVSFYSHDAPLLFFVVISAILIIFLVTAVFGRIWCGWSCPQTVFIHAVFNKIEKLVLGHYSQRFKFFSNEVGFKKQLKIAFLYLLFFIVSSILAHSFTAYFLGSSTVLAYISDGPKSHLTAFVAVNIMTLVLFFNFGFFREKFCFYVCPYGRFQNALIDNNSLTVYYDKVRGEPRSKINGLEDSGDCVDCFKCVRACPTKIDIRNGFQMECIACGKCIDACNSVMEKLDRPPQLIRYETGNLKKITLHRFRLYLYAVLLFVFTASFILMLSQRSLLEVSLARAHEMPFSSRLVDGKKVYINQIQLHLKNTTSRELYVKVHLSDENLSRNMSLVTPAVAVVLQPSQDLTVPAFVQSGTADSQQFELEFSYAQDLDAQDSFKIIKKKMSFIGGEK